MCKTITQRVKLSAPPEVVYEVLSDSAHHSAMTGKVAMLGRAVGDTFSIGAGEVSGVTVDLAPGRRLVQAWRHRDFPEGIYSMAAITLTPTPDGGTALLLTHRGVPKHLIPNTEHTWRDQYWRRMKTYLQGLTP